MAITREIAEKAKAWPFDEARRLLKRLGGKPPEKGYVLFETGYGPSGLPHIGTFGEVQRTTMVQRAFQELSDIPTKLFAFSDDMDGFRKVPENLPNQDLLTENLNKPLTEVPDPFGTHESFAHHNNARLRAFLDDFGFDYEFKSSTECYKAGLFDDALKRMLEVYDDVMGIMLPTLGAERQKTYSPFLPICPETGHVLQVPVIETDPSAGTIVYQRDDGTQVETEVTGGKCKLQWKPDWAMRWYAFSVDYEMSGKDLIDSVQQSGRIAKALGGRTPQNLTYELFLDENGEKISKSRGNGLTIEEWLSYAPKESLALFMFQKPKSAKRLYFDVIPKNVDDYLNFLGKFPEEEPARQAENPSWHIHRGDPPPSDVPLNFAILLNLASVCNTEDKAVLWGFITRYAPEASPEKNPTLDAMVGFAIRYYQDFVKPTKSYRAATEQEQAALGDLAAALDDMAADAEASDLQNQVYEIGKSHGFENLRDWFKACYEVLFGQEQGPRMGSFIALYGVAETATLIRRALAGDDLSAE
ncbi:MAG: lysine--tRNA ligase [Rhodospirillaceae bacterium]|nr:lysine--tRNA ligase [Rhodospirillaceae bacterium]MBL25376.1 lysine--tRNA ligase [Rhodospirillaceae bacterium]